MVDAAAGWGRGVVAAALTLVVAASTARPVMAQVWPCDVRTSDRIVAVGDVHGAYEPFATILRAAGLIDQRERWTGGRAVLIQTGDVLDRGPDSRKVVDLLRKLERDASRAGGRVVALLGNHELMRLIGDWRYVSAGEYAAFRTGGSSDLRARALEKLSAEAAAKAKNERQVFDAGAFRQQFEQEAPLGALEMRLAFDEKGEYGRWVRTRPAVAQVNDLVFLHGGVNEHAAELGCAGINDAIQKDMTSLPLPPERVAALFATSDTGPLWYRGLALDAEATLGPVLDMTLRRLQARAVVIGHTSVLPGSIATRLGGKVVLIDTGMLDGTFFPKGVASALEIKDGALTAIYSDRREPVTAPALQEPTVVAR
jgi:predicted MPP superfamily phosphohydrolase